MDSETQNDAGDVTLDVAADDYQWIRLTLAETRGNPNHWSVELEVSHDDCVGAMTMKGFLKADDAVLYGADAIALAFKAIHTALGLDEVDDGGSL